MKKLTIRQFASIKRIAQNVNPLVVKKNKLLAQAQSLINEAKEIQESIKGYELGILPITDGHSTEELVKKVIEDTGKVDKDGKAIKTTKYVPTNMVTFNEEENCYYINESFIPSEEGTDNSSEEQEEDDIFNL